MKRPGLGEFGAMLLDAREDLRDLIHQSGRMLDDRRYDEFVELFVDDGSYTVEVKAPELPDKMVWMALTRNELSELFASVPEHEWRTLEQTRLIAVDTIEVSSDEAQTSATVAVYHTDDAGRTDCYAVARYDDIWRRIDNRWRLRARRVDLRTRLLAIPSPLPI